MRLIIDYLYDFLKATWISIICSLSALLVFTGLGLLRSKRSVHALLIWDQRCLLIISALGLFVVSGLLLKRSDATRLVNEASWREHFKRFNFNGVLAIIFAGFILIAGLFDYLLQ
ncbi:hypothetical protein M3N64_07025 [Sporolactobacillus sp. CPB3-1]|uniref:Uncharacterized protein n=1 Tax=Sporolactobacillus mangiferae TaxID=2940498 RepID=A0ABT0MA06_9BACL|nr:hypothetical protein [Sporolactobacillus mangiferae]MCL1631700.1 hypothetical protein [Sporolactobacillus mangiferae]